MSYVVSESDLRSMGIELIHQLTLYHERHHLTQADIARKLGVTKATISRVATGVVVPSSLVLVGLFRLYSVPEMAAKIDAYNLYRVSL